jgi:hypothetical protein
MANKESSISRWAQKERQDVTTSNERAICVTADLGLSQLELFEVTVLSSRDQT